MAPKKIRPTWGPNLSIIYYRPSTTFSVKAGWYDAYVTLPDEV